MAGHDIPTLRTERLILRVPAATDFPAYAALLASPAIPSTCQTVWERIGLPGTLSDQRLPRAAAWGGYPGGLTVTKGESLFPRKG